MFLFIYVFDQVKYKTGAGNNILLLGPELRRLQMGDGGSDPSFFAFAILQRVSRHNDDVFWRIDNRRVKV